jgi:hypothetical protein
MSHNGAASLPGISRADLHCGPKYGLIFAVAKPWQREGILTVAQKTQVTLIDDLDGSQADETLRFSIGRDTYEIDLNKTNAKKLRDALAVYVNSARRVGGRGRPATRAAGGRPRGRGRAAASAGVATPAQIRAWAKSRGIKVNERGRISSDIVAKYEAAH